MRTVQLDIGDETIPYAFLGVSCTDAGHKFCWNLNQTLGTHLGYHTELEVIHKKKRPKTRHCVWRHEDEEEGYTFDVIWNRVPEGAMIPTLVHFDYLIRVESMMGERAATLMEALRSMRRVAACFPVAAPAITQPEVLYYE